MEVPIGTAMAQQAFWADDVVAGKTADADVHQVKIAIAVHGTDNIAITDKIAIAVEATAERQTLRRLYWLAQAHHRNCATSQSLSLFSSCDSCCFTPRRRSSTPTMRPNLCDRSASVVSQ